MPASSLARVITLQDLSNVIKQFATQILQAQTVTFYSCSEDNFSLQLLSSSGLSQAEADVLRVVSRNSLVPIAIAGFEGREVFREQAPSFCAIPIQLHQRILGVIGLQYNDQQTFDKDFQRFVLTFADQCAQAFERARLYEIERSARQEAEAASQAKSRFLANVSHEIRTPLAAIIGFAELLTEDVVLPDEQAHCINRILRNGQLLAEMLNNILDLSKIESEKVEIEQIDFELIPLVEEVISLLQLKAQEKGLQLALTAIGLLPDIIHSRSDRLRQILINLLGNAIKFTEKGSVEVRIIAETTPVRNDQLRFSIIDSGIGIPPNQQSRIFEPFMQADSSTSRRFGGTGLGLALSQESGCSPWVADLDLGKVDERRRQHFHLHNCTGSQFAGPRASTADCAKKPSPP